jgi:hypothetical protein
MGSLRHNFLQRAIVEPWLPAERLSSHSEVLAGALVRGPRRLVEGAEVQFDNILDRVTGSDPSVTDYILETPAKCPNCWREILEKTLIEPVNP